MSTIVTRSGKGSPLSHVEVDANFTNLNTDKIQSGNTVAALTITSATINGGSINGTTVGATTRSTGAFTTLASNGATTFTAGTASTSTTTGTAVITGGLGVSGRINAANFDGIVGANTAAAGNFTTLGATGVATFSAGTAAAPAITTTGDTNTGIFFPAADHIAFVEGGVEAMRIDGNGKVGIGTTTPNAELQLGAAAPTIRIGASASSAYLDISRDGATGFSIYNAAQADPYRGHIWQLGGAEAMRINSSGNVGIGTSSPGYKLDVRGGSIANINSGADALFIIGEGVGTAEYGFLRWDRTNNVLQLATDAAAPVAFWTNNNERMRIDSSGNLLVGTTTASYSAANRGVLNISGSSGGLLALISSTNKSYLIQSGADLLIENDTASGNMVFGTGSSTERMRIDSSGNVLVGTTSNPYTAKVAYVQTSNGTVMSLTGGATSALTQIAFVNPNGLVGSVTTNASATAYNTSSDYRLKENIAPMTGALAKVAALKPVTYKWKSDGSYGQGFIAHELAEVVPDCVTGEKDAVDAEGKPQYQGIDTSFLVATLTAAIQELKTELDSVKAELQTLKGV